MRCSTIVCVNTSRGQQRLRFGLKDDFTGRQTAHAGALRVDVLGYAQVSPTEGESCARSVQGVIDAIVNESSADDILLLATHNLNVRLPLGDCFACADYQGGHDLLSEYVAQAFRNEPEGDLSILRWFWRNSRDLPPRGLNSLYETLGAKGPRGWSRVREEPDFRSAIAWLRRLEGSGTPPEVLEVSRIFDFQEDVPADLHARIMAWLERYPGPAFEAFAGLCGVSAVEAA